MAFLNIGLTSSTAPMAAILMASNPLLVALLAGVLLDEPVRRPNPAGSGTVNGSVTGASTASICGARSARPVGLQSRCSGRSLRPDVPDWKNPAIRMTWLWIRQPRERQRLQRGQQHHMLGRLDPTQVLHPHRASELQGREEAIDLVVIEWAQACARLRHEIFVVLVSFWFVVDEMCEIDSY